MGCPAAISTAFSRLPHSRMSNPPTASLVSANGPSVTSAFPSRTRTEHAPRGGASWSPVTQTPAPGGCPARGSSPRPECRSDRARSGRPCSRRPSRQASGISSSLLSSSVSSLTDGRRTLPIEIDICSRRREQHSAAREGAIQLPFLSTMRASMSRSQLKPWRDFLTARRVATLTGRTTSARLRPVPRAGRGRAPARSAGGGSAPGGPPRTNGRALVRRGR
jgi:hypothetical protein